MVVLASFILVLGISCSKSDQPGAQAKGTIFVRVVQVDKDGGKTYSKIVPARTSE